MASNFDIFNNLNSYLNKKGEESFQYDSASSTPNSSIAGIHSKENTPDANSASPIIIAETNTEVIEINEQETGLSQRARRARKRNATSSLPSNSSNESIDLTDESLLSPNKSRRRLADDLGGVAEAEIDLCANFEPVAEQPKGRGKGRPKKAPVEKKTSRKVSYKKALAAARQPLPELPKEKTTTTVSLPLVAKPLTPTDPARPAQRTYDLTGDVELTAMHSSRPLFEKSKLAASTSTSHDTSMEPSDDDFSTITMHIKLNGIRKEFKHKPESRLYELFEAISEREKVPIKQIYLYDEKENRILPEQTPKDIGHKFSTIYVCRIMNPKSTKVDKQNRIELKFQSDKWKKPIVLKASRMDTFKNFIETLCKQVNFKPEQFSLKFDGDDVELSQTPMGLEFEGGEILDCRIKV